MSGTLRVLPLGGVGVVSVAAHLAGRQIKGMIEAFCDGKVEEAAAAFRRLADIFRLLFVEPNPIPLKAAMGLIGIEVGEPRLPLTPALTSTVDALRDALAELA